MIENNGEEESLFGVEVFCLGMGKWCTVQRENRRGNQILNTTWWNISDIPQGFFSPQILKYRERKGKKTQQISEKYFWKPQPTYF